MSHARDYPAMTVGGLASAGPSEAGCAGPRKPSG
jgi:hypothetical protein